MRLALVAAATLAMSAAATAQEVVKVGSHPKYAFSNPMVNNLGVKSLADLEGRPVLVEFWGTH
jgi:ABC-type nitrate/sulfonate/bicarbonate transport system substrate-binding protein